LGDLIIIPSIYNNSLESRMTHFEGREDDTDIGAKISTPSVATQK
jgi:hypothetical protein